MRTLTKELQTKITPEDAVKMLKNGNQRFVNNLKVNRNLLQQVNDTSDGQHPFAVIISCMDSRTSAELIFDQGLGDVFSIRVAGNVINEEILGSAEYGCKVVGAKTILVLGHTNCGAVSGAVNDVELGHLHFITNKIKRALPLVKQGNHHQTQGDICAGVTRENVLLGIQDLKYNSSILADMVHKGEINIIGGVYDINTGVVEFIEEATRN